MESTVDCTSYSCVVSQTNSATFIPGFSSNNTGTLCSMSVKDKCRALLATRYDIITLSFILYNYLQISASQGCRMIITTNLYSNLVYFKFFHTFWEISESSGKLHVFHKQQNTFVGKAFVEIISPRLWKGQRQITSS